MVILSGENTAGKGAEGCKPHAVPLAKRKILVFNAVASKEVVFWLLCNRWNTVVPLADTVHLLDKVGRPL